MARPGFAIAPGVRNPLKAGLLGAPVDMDNDRFVHCASFHVGESGHWIQTSSFDPVRFDWCRTMAAVVPSMTPLQCKSQKGGRKLCG
jgi:hypothetical protein